MLRAVWQKLIRLTFGLNFARNVRRALQVGSRSRNYNRVESQKPALDAFCSLDDRLKRKTTAHYGICTARTINRKYNRVFVLSRRTVSVYLIIVCSLRAICSTWKQTTNCSVLSRRCKISRNNKIYNTVAQLL